MTLWHVVVTTTHRLRALVFDIFTPLICFLALMRAAALGAANRGAIMLGANESASQKFGILFYGAKCPKNKLPVGG
jgi:hypothetical protein